MESEINRREHHDLNRCLDIGLAGCLRYVGYGVMSYNLHEIGREWLRRERARGEPLAPAALKAPGAKLPAKSDRSGVTGVGEFGWLWQ